MGTPLSLFTGVWFSLFGGAVIWWCAAEVRLRRALRRVGVSGMARVVAATAPEPVPAAVGAGAGATDADAADHGGRTDRAAVTAAAARDAAQVVANGGSAGRAGSAEDNQAADAVEDVDHADNAPLLSFEVEGHGEVLTRPRGWTSIRRSSALAVGTLVPIAYDPQQPTRVALQGVPQSRSDVFWLLLGLTFAGCGAALLATAF